MSEQKAKRGAGRSLTIALLIFFVNSGITLGLKTIIIGQCTFLISYVFIVVSARLAGMDRTLDDHVRAVSEAVADTGDGVSPSRSRRKE